MQEIEAVRGFNRFYTRFLGLLEDRLLDSPLSLAEARVLWEIGHAADATARDLGAQLGLDKGLLSRLLKSLQRQGLLLAEADERDRRLRRLTLTPAGQEQLQELELRSRRQIADALSELGSGERQRLVRAMRTVQELLERADVVAATSSSLSR